jgi:Sec-independent protein translocase protein TatA
MVILGAAALLFFGPDQLPKVARKAGHVMRDIQSTSQSFIREMERAADEAEFKEATARMETVAPVVDPAPVMHVPDLGPVTPDPVSPFADSAPIPGSVPRPEVNLHDPLDVTMSGTVGALPYDPMKAGHMPPERAADTP